MFKRVVFGFAVAVAAILLASSNSPAQPGKSADSVKKLEAELEKLRDQVKEAEADLAKAKEAAKNKPGFDGKSPFGKDFGKGKGSPFGKPGFGPRGFDGKKKEEPKKDDAKKELAKDFASKFDPATVKAKYDFYKKLYDQLPRDASKTRPSFDRKRIDPVKNDRNAGSVDARLDRLAKELDDLRKELKKR